MYHTPQRRHVLGLDLGQAQDHTALAMISWQLMPLPTWGTRPPPVHYDVPTLQRWPVGTSYRDIISALKTFMCAPPLDQAPATLIIDETGVGLPVAQMFLDALVRGGVKGFCCAVAITDGHDVIHHGESRWRVPKKVLVSDLQVLFQSRRLHVAAGLPEAQTLMKELQCFRTKVTAVRSDTLESWREREYDDL